MKLQESGENYLETILILKKRHGYVRSIDIATELGFSKPSISRAISILKDSGYVVVEPTGNIILTEKGQKRADDVYDKHIYISKYLEKNLGISKEIADKDACRIEHIISEESFLKMKEAVIEKEQSLN